MTQQELLFAEVPIEKLSLPNKKSHALNLLQSWLNLVNSTLTKIEEGDPIWLAKATKVVLKVGSELQDYNDQIESDGLALISGPDEFPVDEIEMRILNLNSVISEPSEFRYSQAMEDLFSKNGAVTLVDFQKLARGPYGVQPLNGTIPKLSQSDSAGTYRELKRIRAAILRQQKILSKVEPVDVNSYWGRVF